MNSRMRFDTRSYLAAQQQEVLGPLNRYYAGLTIGRDPSPEDCWRHWCSSQAPEAFRSANHHRFWIADGGAADES